MGEGPFGDWGWRIPFLLSAILLAVSLWIRLKLNESPLFRRMVEEGKQSRGPLADAFGEWRNCKVADRRAVGRDRWRSRHLVWRAVLRAVFPHPDFESARGYCADHGCRRAGDRHAVFYSVRCLIKSDRMQGDHAGRLCAWLGDLLFHLSGDHAFRQSQTGAGARRGTGDRHRRSQGMLFQFKATGTEKYTSGCDNIK